MWNEARTINRLANTLAVLAVLAMLAGGIYWLIQRPAFNLRTIEIEPAPNSSLKYVSPASVRASIAGQLSGNFFTISLGSAKSVFEAVPWVRNAMVRRIWPNALRVTIEEQQPFALWNENQMINTWGQTFTANQGELEDDDSLPQFEGPEGYPGRTAVRCPYPAVRPGLADRESETGPPRGNSCRSSLSEWLCADAGAAAGTPSTPKEALMP